MENDLFRLIANPYKLKKQNIQHVDYYEDLFLLLKKKYPNYTIDYNIYNKILNKIENTLIENIIQEIIVSIINSICII